MAPEVIRREGASYNSDVFSLGVTVYELIKAKRPFSPEEIARTASGEASHQVLRNAVLQLKLET